MSGDKLAAKFIVTINGKRYASAPGPSESGQPLSMEVEHRDNEPSRLVLSIWDAVNNPNVVPFPEFNSMPNPRCNPEIPVEAWGGWEDGEYLRMFTGILLAKRIKYQLSITEFAALHRMMRLRKRGKVDTLTNITVAQLLKKKARRKGSTSRLRKASQTTKPSILPLSGSFSLANQIGG